MGGLCKPDSPLNPRFRTTPTSRTLIPPDKGKETSKLPKLPNFQLFLFPFRLLPPTILLHIQPPLLLILRIILCKLPPPLFLKRPILRIIRIPFPTRRLPTFRVCRISRIPILIIIRVLRSPRLLTLFLFLLICRVIFPPLSSIFPLISPIFLSAFLTGFRAVRFRVVRFCEDRRC